MANTLALFTAPDKGLPMIYRHSVRLLKEQGIEGDRYALGTGAYSQAKPLKPRHVTLIAIEMLEAANRALDLLGCEPYTPEQTRRNILTAGIDLNAYVGKRLQIGDAVLEGFELADPCLRPPALLKRTKQEAEAFKVSFNARGGLRAQVIAGGVISINKSIVPL